MTELVLVLAAFGVAWIATPLAAALGHRWGLVDHPEGPLKIHTRATPRTGGFALALSLAVVAALASPFGVRLFAPAEWTLAALLFALGVWDDRRPRSPRLRLGLQASIYLIGWLLGVRIVLTQVPAVDLALGLGLFVTIVNAVNFYDGLDGLVALTATAALGIWGVLTLHMESTGLPFLLGSCALFGFLPRNWYPARIFLGDGGSFLVGFLLYLVLVRATAAGWGVTPGLWVVALPVCDAAGATLYRLWKRRDVWTGDRDHIYDILLRFGWSTPRVALFLSLMAALCARGALWVLQQTTAVSWTITVGMYVLITVLIFLLRCRYGMRTA